MTKLTQKQRDMLSWNEAVEKQDKAQRAINFNEIIDVLKQLKLKHYECGDPWYSCPKSGECANEALDPEVCNCGADTHNQKVDDAIANLLKFFS